jgi:hypothetical protein
MMGGEGRTRSPHSWGRSPTFMWLSISGDVMGDGGARLNMEYNISVRTAFCAVLSASSCRIFGFLNLYVVYLGLLAPSLLVVAHNLENGVKNTPHRTGGV